MALIDLSNYATTLIPSTVGRVGAPDGNVFFDLASGLIEFIPADEVATLDLTSIGGGATDPNPLIRADGIKFEAIYAFENQERASSPILGEALRMYDRFTSGTFKFGGAYNFVNGNVPSTAPDRAIIRGSGWNENDVNGIPIRKYFGNKGLSNIEALSQPSYQQSIQGTATDFAKVGQIDEAILVYQDLDANGTPDIDLTTYEAVSIRTYGNNYDRKNTVDDLGITELGGYSTGFALNESVHLTTSEASMPFANVSTTPIGVWATMALNHIAVPVAKTGEFSDDTGSLLFSWELINNNSATLDQCVAWLDAFSTEAAKEADGLAVNTGHLGKDIETWYTYNASGQIVTKSGVTPASEGMYITNVPVADQQRVVFTADDAAVKAYSFSVSVEAEIGATAKADVAAWYHSWFFAAYNSAVAVVVLNSVGAEVKGLASTADVDNKIIFAFDYTGDTQGGAADSDKDCVFVCEGDGGATQAKTLYTIKKLTTVAFTCSPGVENNA
tara:strand:- start:12242 stop:13744 length:1503 start_codon:yes stop_codon:yes gene_type:complete